MKFIDNKLNMCLKEREFSDEWKKKLKETAHKRTDNMSSELREFYSKKLIALNKSRTGVKKPHQSGRLNCFASKKTKEKIKLVNVAKYGVSNPSLVPYTCEHCDKSGSGLAGYHRWVARQ